MRRFWGKKIEGKKIRLSFVKVVKFEEGGFYFLVKLNINDVNKEG